MCPRLTDHYTECSTRCSTNKSFLTLAYPLVTMNPLIHKDLWLLHKEYRWPSAPYSLCNTSETLVVSTFNRLITLEGYAKVLHINTSYLHIRGSTYYYSRRVPQDLQEKYSTKKIVVSLRTKSKRTALLSSSHLSMELEGYWSSIRIKRVVKKYIHTPDSSSLSLSGITM